MAGRTAMGHRWEARGTANGKVLVQHGWGGSVAQMSAPIRALVDAGATVVAFDAFGHGETGPGRHGGRQSSLIELSDFVEEVEQQFGPFTAVVTHSAASAAVARAMRRGMAVERAVFVAPLVDPLGQSHRLSDALALSPSVARQWPAVLLAKFGSSRADIDMTIPPPPERMPRALIIQDQDDQFSPPEGARKLHQAWSGSQLIETHGLGHYRIQNDPQVLGALVQFVMGEADQLGGSKLVYCEPSAEAAT
jgi:pimeloyl-ACP methyl ester carboxylesterase